MVTYLVERGDCHILEKEGDNRVEEGDDCPREDPDAGTHDAKLELETGDVGGDDLRCDVMARGVDVVRRDRREGEPACYVDAEHLCMERGLGGVVGCGGVRTRGEGGGTSS